MRAATLRPPLFDRHWGIALRHDPKNLRSWLNVQYFVSKADEKLDALYRKYPNILMPNLPTL